MKNSFVASYVWVLAGFAAALTGCGSGAAVGADDQGMKDPNAMGHVMVRDGGFYDKKTDQPFLPRGLNYIHLRDVGWHWHDTFNPAMYDGPRAGVALADMAGAGFNIVRVFIDQTPGPGTVESVESESLSPAYMANVVDFLGRARSNDIRVIFAMCRIPLSARYNRISGVKPPGIGGNNLYLLSETHALAKATYMADFAAAIKQAAPSLLGAVFAYELDNESHFDTRAAPFTMKSARFGYREQVYSLRDSADLQRLADDGTKMVVNLAVDAVKAVDPDVMVSVNVFTFAAVRRTGPAKVLEDESRDARFPVRPLTLTETKVDYIDIHLYSASERQFQRDLKSIEWPEFSAAAAKAGKPLLMGEFGAFKGRNPDIDDAVRRMREQIARTEKAGFVGWLYWTYDSDIQKGIWNAKMADGKMFTMLTEVAAQSRQPDSE